jgi:acetylornithine deacetylase/succinyl-diaminopimelate desuccinylase-like protein
MLYDGPVIDALQRAFQKVWGTDLTLMRMGGSVPILGAFEEELGVPMTSLGLCNGGQIHAPNEYLDLEYHQINIDTAIHFFYYLAESHGGE